MGLGQYRELFSTQFWSAARNTALFALIAPTLALLLSFLLCWSAQRVRRPARYALDILTFLPLAIPSAVLAVGAITLALFLGSLVPIYGTLLLIIMVEAVARLPIATRAIGAALLQIHKELDEAGAVFGLRAANRAWRITLPLILPALLYSWFLLAILAFRELTVPIMLASKDSITLSVYTFGLLSTGSFGRAAALTLVVLAVLAVLAIFATLASRLFARNTQSFDH